MVLTIGKTVVEVVLFHRPSRVGRKALLTPSTSLWVQEESGGDKVPY